MSTRLNTAHNETQIILDKEVPLVRIIREFDAPPARVFRAHTDAKLYAQWLGPHGSVTDVESFDCRSGGSYRFVMRGEDYTAWFRGCFHEIRENELIIQTFTYEEFPDGVALERLAFEDIGGGRTRLTTTSLVDSFEGRDAFVASGMEVGVREGYERLDAVLASMK